MDRRLTEDRCVDVPLTHRFCGWRKMGMFCRSAARAHVLGAQDAQIRAEVQAAHSLTELDDDEHPFIQCSCGWTSGGHLFMMWSAKRHISRSRRLVSLNHGL